MTATKITGLTSHNVVALRASIQADPPVVELTATTATFLMEPRQALRLVNDTIACLPRDTTRHSLHAVRRKLERAVEATQ